MSTDLVKRLRARPDNERLWEAWYKAAYPKLYYAAFRLAAGNRDMARDLAQETFTRFLEYRAIERVESEAHALSYLIKTCRNLAIDRNARADDVPLDDLLESDQMAARREPTEDLVDLNRAVHGLRAEDRTLAQWMREGLSVSEIARKLGITYTAAGVRVHRLKGRLRQALG